MSRQGAPVRVRLAKSYPSDLSDARWALIEPTLTAWRAERQKASLNLGGKVADLREVMNAILRLAGKESVGPDDFSDEPLVACADATPTWYGFWRLEPRSDGNTAPLGPVAVDTFEDKLELIADGQAIGVLPASDRCSTLRDDVATIPMEGIDACQVVVVTRASDSNPLVAHFRESAENLRACDAW
jgi:DNA-binding transcriptional LysR family regulator